MSRYSLAATLCLLSAGGLIAVQTSVGPLATADASSILGLPASAFDPTRAPEGINIRTPTESYQQDAASWSTRAAYPDPGVYRGLAGAWERQADSSFLYAIGGQSTYNVYSKACYRYNSATNAWTQMADMPVASSDQCAVYWQDNGGGNDSSGVLTFGTFGGVLSASCYWWNKSTNTWTQLTSYEGSPSCGNMAAVVGDTAFLMTHSSPHFQAYSIREGTWATRPEPPTVNYFGAMCASQGKVYQCGGWPSQLTFQEYDPVAGTWQLRASCPGVVGGNSPHLAPWDYGSLHRVYCWGGGYAWIPKDGVARWNPAADFWTTEGTIPEAIVAAFFGAVAEFPGPTEGLNHACGLNNSCQCVTTHRRGVPDVPADNDVGVSKILSPADPYYPFGDTIFPRAEVQNYGLQPQTNIPAICVMYDTVTGTRVYGPETVYVAALDPDGIDTVEFPCWIPPTQERVYSDTMATALPGDEKPENDGKAGRVVVSQWGPECLTYNDGTFDNGVSWITANSELAERFIAPTFPLTVEKAVVWMSSWTGGDYASEIRIYANDGTPYGYPGTQLGAWVGNLHTGTWPAMQKNEVHFEPPIVVASDTFFVSYFQDDIYPCYPYLGMDYALPVEQGNDWGRYAGGGGTWGVFPYDACMDFGIDVCRPVSLLDGSIIDITVPPGEIDSNTTFDPQIVVKNTGLKSRSNIPVAFNIVRATGLADTIYSGTANSGPVAAGQQVAVTFAGANVTPGPGEYTMTGISLLPFDTRPGNDTLVRSLTVGRTGVATEGPDVGRASFAITPNPLGEFAAVRYSLPKAGLVTLGVYDASGREVLLQTIAAERLGTAELDLRRLRAGVYIVKVTTEGFSTTQKVIVEH